LFLTQTLGEGLGRLCKRFSALKLSPYMQARKTPKASAHGLCGFMLSRFDRGRFHEKRIVSKYLNIYLYAAPSLLLRLVKFLL
jgi:hypothetical protein